MTKHYSFSCFDTEDKSQVSIQFETDNDTWGGYDGPVYQFFNFLRGCGFCFDLSAEMGIVDEKGEFVSATQDF